MRLAIEHDANEKRWLISVLPVARTPQDKKSSRSLSRYAKRLHQAVDDLTPWVGKRKRSRLLDKAKEIEGETGVSAGVTVRD